MCKRSKQSITGRPLLGCATRRGHGACIGMNGYELEENYLQSRGDTSRRPWSGREDGTSIKRQKLPIEPGVGRFPTQREVSRARGNTAVARRRALRSAVADPVCWAIAVIACIVGGWWMNSADGWSSTSSGSTNVDVTVLEHVAYTPSFTAGSRAVRLSELSQPGDMATARSGGWKLSSNWSYGYSLTGRATTAPALRGRNATDGNGADGAFADFRRRGCPCLWSTKGFDKGIFGYSVEASRREGTLLDTEKWGGGDSRRWRGFTRTDYQLMKAGGTGQFSMNLLLRTQIPEQGVQEQGSYRANLVVGVTPVLAW